MRNYPSVPNVFRVASSHSVNNEATYVPNGRSGPHGTAAPAVSNNRNAAAIYDAKVNANLGTTTIQQQQQQQQNRTLQSLANVNKTANIQTTTAAAAASIAATGGGGGGGVIGDGAIAVVTSMFAATTAPSANINTFGSSYENEQLKHKQYLQHQHQQQQQQHQQQRYQFHSGQSVGSNGNGNGANVGNCNGNDAIINKLTTTASVERNSYQNGRDQHYQQQQKQYHLQLQQQQQPHSPYATLPRTISGISNGDLRLSNGRNSNGRNVAGVINTISGSIPATGFTNGRTTSIGSDLNSTLNNSCTDLAKANGEVTGTHRQSYEDYRFTRISKDSDGHNYSSKRMATAPGTGTGTGTTTKMQPTRRLDRNSNNSGYLWILTPVAASISVAIVIAALAGPQWLFTEEKLPNSLYNGTANFNQLDDGAYITKYTKSSLWILCTTLQGIETYNCIKIDYFSKEGYAPDPHDSTSAIPYTVTKSCPFFLASGIALLISFIVFLIPTCSHQNSLYYFSAGIMFIVSGLLMLIGLIAYISILKSEIGSKLRSRSTLQPALFKVNYGQSFFLFVFGFVTTEFVGLLNIFLYISLQEISYYSRLPCFTLANFREKIKEGENPRSQTYKSYKHTNNPLPTNDRRPQQRMRASGGQHQVHNVPFSRQQNFSSETEHPKTASTSCRKHPSVRENTNLDTERRYYFENAPTMKCNLHSRNLAKSLNELYTEPVLPPPPPSTIKAGVKTLPRPQQSPTVAQFADLPQEFPLTRSVSTTTDIFQSDANGRNIDSRGQTPHLERKSRRNMATNTRRPTDTELQQSQLQPRTHNECDVRQLANSRRRQTEYSNNDEPDDDLPQDNDDDDGDDEPQRLCGLKRGIRKTKDELFQEFCKRAGMRPKPKNIYYIANEEETLRRKRHNDDLGGGMKPNGLRIVMDDMSFEEDDDGFKQLPDRNNKFYGLENNQPPIPNNRNVRRASMFAAEPTQLRKLNSNLSLHTLYPQDVRSGAYQQGFYDPLRNDGTSEVWPSYPVPLQSVYGGSQSRLDSTSQLQQGRATLPRSFLRSSADSQDSIASASLQGLHNAYSASQTRLPTLLLQQQQQQHQRQHLPQQDHFLTLSRGASGGYLHKSYDDLNASNYLSDAVYGTRVPTESTQKPPNGNTLQQPVIQWPATISPSNLAANYQIYGAATKVHAPPLQHALVSRSASSGGSGAMGSNGLPKFQRAFAFDEQRRASTAVDAFDLDEMERDRRRSHASLFNGSIIIAGQAYSTENSTNSTGDHYDIVNGTAV